MTVLLDPPAQKPIAGIHSLELEITSVCQLKCRMCLSSSSPQASHGDMTPRDWRAVIFDAAALGIRTIQMIGGEPTVHPKWREFVTLALSLGRHVEIYSNLYEVKERDWALFADPRVTLGTSYYSDRPEEHDAVTQVQGSYVRTRANIREALQRGITVRAGIVDVLPGQHVAEGRAELEAMGITNIIVDRARAVGRAALPGVKPSLDVMCGRCTRGRAAIMPTGDLTGCVLSRDFPAGNVLHNSLAELLGGKAWADLAASIPPVQADACPPDDSGDCGPANTTACGPAYD